MENNNNDCQTNAMIEDTVWKYGCKIIFDDIKPKYNNLKDEVLNNTFANISKRGWNDTLRKCSAIFKVMFESLFHYIYFLNS